jgi:hypothetical protein
MKIGKGRRERAGGILSWLGVLVLLFVLGLALDDAGRDLVSRDLRISWDWLSRPADAEDLPTLVVDMPFASYDTLLGHRERALQDGVYVPSEQDFVNATIRIGDAVVPVRIRLLEGLADHLAEGGKWGLEVRTRQDQQLLGLQRFYLEDPAGNNWLAGWAFARALEDAGVLVARYRFVRLVFNGDSWGIYALQEGFGSELLAAQGRREGVIVRFDADLLWRSIAHFGGDAHAAYTDPVANLSAADFRFFELDTFRDADIDRDPELSAQRERALAMLRALQAGEAAASEVLDVEQYGRFLALVDLWGATEATSLVNLRYHYNQDSDRLEPIGVDGSALSSRARLSLAATYGDPILQATYAQEAQRASQPEYVDHLRAELEPELRRLQQAVASEHQDGVSLWDELYERQDQIRRSLNPVQPVLAYLGPPETSSEGIVRLYVGNVLNLPIEIVGFDIHGATVLPANREWVPGDPMELLAGAADHIVLRAFAPAQVQPVRYVRFDLPLTEIHRLDAELDWMQPLEVQVITRIWGLSTTQMTLAQEGYPGVLVTGGS